MKPHKFKLESVDEPLTIQEPSYGAVMGFFKNLKRQTTPEDLMGLCIGKDAAFVNSLPFSDGMLLAAQLQPLIVKVQQSYEVYLRMIGGADAKDKQSSIDVTIRQH